MFRIVVEAILNLANFLLQFLLEIPLLFSLLFNNQLLIAIVD